MKITGKNPSIDAQVNAQKAKRDLKAPIGSSITGSKGISTTDKVNVSGKAKRLAQLRKLVEASPDVREEKIAQIKDAVDDGKYNVRSARVAENIIKKAIHFYNSHRFPS